MGIYALHPHQDDWGELLDNFIKLHARGTRQQYKAALREFEEMTGKTICEAHETDVYKFVEHQLERKGYKSRLDPADTKICNATVLNKVGKLKALHDLLVREGFVEGEPFSGVMRFLGKARYGEKRPTGALTAEQVKKLLTLPGKDKKGVRDYALLCLLFGAALRISEALNLNLADVCESTQGTLFLRLRHTKSGHAQEHALQDWVAQSIKTLMAQRKEEGATDFLPLIVVYRADGRAKANHVRYETFYRWWGKWVREAGLPESTTSHFGRATAITKLLSEGLSYREVQEFSRHASIQLVEHYDKRRFSLDNAPQKKLKY